MCWGTGTTPACTAPSGRSTRRSRELAWASFHGRGWHTYSKVSLKKKSLFFKQKSLSGSSPGGKYSKVSYKTKASFFKKKSHSGSLSGPYIYSRSLLKKVSFSSVTEEKKLFQDGRGRHTYSEVLYIVSVHVKSTTRPLTLDFFFGTRTSGTLLPTT